MQSNIEEIVSPLFEKIKTTFFVINYVVKNLWKVYKETKGINFSRSPHTNSQSCEAGSFVV